MPEQTGYRPGKTAIALGLLAGVAYTLVGLLITARHFGAVGVCWTLVAGGVLAFYGTHLFVGPPDPRKPRVNGPRRQPVDRGRAGSHDV